MRTSAPVPPPIAPLHNKPSPARAKREGCYRPPPANPQEPAVPNEELQMGKTDLLCAHLNGRFSCVVKLKEELGTFKPELKRWLNTAIICTERMSE